MRHLSFLTVECLAVTLALCSPPATYCQSARSFVKNARLSEAVAPTTIPLQNLEQYIAELHQYVSTRKVDLLGQAMKFTPEQAGKFWPIYAAYTSELQEVDEIRLKVVRDYAVSFNTLDNAMADALAQREFHFLTKRLALQQRYYEAVKRQLGAKVAARFLQVESRLVALEDLQVAAQVPLVE
jgi:hypothetical protein